MTMNLGEPVIEHIVRVTGPISLRGIRAAITELHRASMFFEPVEIRMTPPGMADVRAEIHQDVSFMGGGYQPGFGDEPENLWGFDLKATMPRDLYAWELVWRAK